jgi:hypothetical protein
MPGEILIWEYNNRISIGLHELCSRNRPDMKMLLLHTTEVCRLVFLNKVLGSPNH